MGGWNRKWKWKRYDGSGGRVFGGGGWSRIKYGVASMECVEHNTDIGHNIMNKYGIENF